MHNQETIAEIIWCWTHYPSSDKMRPDLSIKSSTELEHNGYVISLSKMLHYVSKYPSHHYPF